MKENGNYDDNNKGRVVVITGSSRGIGKSIAAEFANAGYSVVINARSEQELNQAAEEISKYSNDGGKIISQLGSL
jgi:NAD(P)-dependent dehydrogenase (short-subunit alcohol dehydrogenase family)